MFDQLFNNTLMFSRSQALSLSVGLGHFNRGKKLVPFSKISISQRIFQTSLKILQILYMKNIQNSVYWRIFSILKIMKSPVAKKPIFLILFILFPVPHLFFIIFFFLRHSLLAYLGTSDLWHPLPYFSRESWACFYRWELSF